MVAAVGGHDSICRPGLGESQSAGRNTRSGASTQDLEAKVFSVSGKETSLQQSIDKNGTLGIHQASTLARRKQHR